jgi:hypothetical protein
MDLVDVKLPSDVVARVNPNFVWKKRQSLTPLVFALGSHGSVPLGLDHLWND